MTELTLRFNDDLILHAKAHAARTGKPLADLVAGYLASLAAEPAGPSAEMPAAAVVEEPPASASDSLPERQYRLASQYPGEYVVLVAERVVYHSTDRKEAGRAYNQAFRDYPGAAPVMVDPGRPRHPRPKPIVRGRALNRRRRT